MIKINIRFRDLITAKQKEIAETLSGTVFGPEMIITSYTVYEQSDLSVDIEEARIERQFLQDSDIH